jgi:hypothetical protein
MHRAQKGKKKPHKPSPSRKVHPSSYQQNKKKRPIKLQPIIRQIVSHSSQGVSHSQTKQNLPPIHNICAPRSSLRSSILSILKRRRRRRSSAAHSPREQRARRGGFVRVSIRKITPSAPIIPSLISSALYFMILDTHCLLI